MIFFFLIFFKFFSKIIEKKFACKSAKSAEETRKKSSKNSDFEFGSVIGGAECHFAEFLFFAVKQATIPDYTTKHLRELEKVCFNVNKK